MIRQATSTDAPAITQLILLAMGKPLAGKFANSDDPEVAEALFTRFAAIPGNQYSYQNVLLYEQHGTICGMIIAYDGAKLDEFRSPFLDYTRSQLGFTGTPEDETQEGEMYIDCLAVLPQYQGQGIAKSLIKALFERATLLEHDTVGLLVSKGNEKAKKLYKDSGFEIVGEQGLLGGVHDHMQRRLK